MGDSSFVMPRLRLHHAYHSDFVCHALSIAQCSDSVLKRREDACALSRSRGTSQNRNRALMEFRTKCFGSARHLRIAFIASTSRYYARLNRSPRRIEGGASLRLPRRSPGEGGTFVIRLPSRSGAKAGHSFAIRHSSFVILNIHLSFSRRRLLFRPTIDLPTCPRLRDKSASEVAKISN
jgi:hypothetical protein